MDVHHYFFQVSHVLDLYISQKWSKPIVCGKTVYHFFNKTEPPRISSVVQLLKM